VNIPLNDDDLVTTSWDDRVVDFSIDHLVERLHRLLVVLEDDWNLRGEEMPALAVYDVRAARWLLASGVSLATLRSDPGRVDGAATYLILVGPETVPVYSIDPAELMAEFVQRARAGASVS
jgi:hypothetical protein